MSCFHCQARAGQAALVLCAGKGPALQCAEALRSHQQIDDTGRNGGAKYIRAMWTPSSQAYMCNPSTWEVGAGAGAGALVVRSRTVWAT